KLLRRAGPEELRFVPEFPIANSIVKAVRPTLVVMHGDVLDHIGELLWISGWICVGAKAAPDAVVNFRPAGANACKHFVCRAEVVALRFLRIGRPVRKNDAGVSCLHYGRSLTIVRNQPSEQSALYLEFGVEFRRPHKIVRANLANAQVLILRDKIGES